MKILMVTPWYPDSLNRNSGIFIQTQAHALKLKHSVLVISSKVNYQKFALSNYSKQVAKEHNLEVHNLIVSKSLLLFNQINHLWLTFYYSFKIAKSFKPDVIHASVGYPGAIWGWALSKRLKCPYIITEHTRIENNFRSFLHRALTLFGIRKAKFVIAVSKYLAKEMQRYIKSNVVVMPNVIETSFFSHVTNSVNSIPQLGFLGGLNTDVKGLDILLEALSKVEENFTLHIGGAGKLETDYKSLADKLGIGMKCIFYGSIPHEEIATFMSEIHFFVCSSRSETFSVALIEAMASGRPVLSTKCGGPEEFVNDNNGLLVEKENIDSLRQGIVKMINSYNQYSSEKIRNDVEERFSTKVFLNSIEDIYINALKS